MSRLCFGDLHLSLKVTPGHNLLNLCQKLLVGTISFNIYSYIIKSITWSNVDKGL